LPLPIRDVVDIFRSIVVLPFFIFTDNALRPSSGGIDIDAVVSFRFTASFCRISGFILIWEILLLPVHPYSHSALWIFASATMHLPHATGASDEAVFRV
jgi:hypothetical protein